MTRILPRQAARAGSLLRGEDIGERTANVDEVIETRDRQSPANLRCNADQEALAVGQLHALEEHKQRAEDSENPPGFTRFPKSSGNHLPKVKCGS